MISDKETNLLIDLIKLLNKYDAYTIKSLEHILNNDVLATDLSQLLNVVKLSSNTIGISKNSSSKKDFEDSNAKKMLQLSKSDPRRYNFIRDFSDSIHSRQILPTKKQMMQFSNNLGIAVSIRDTKKIIIKKIINYLIELPSDEFEQLMLSIKEELNKKDQLEEWADIIFKERNN